MSEVTHILAAIEQGDPHAAEQLLPLVYDELRKLAAHRLAQEKSGQTLQATGKFQKTRMLLIVLTPAPEGGLAPDEQLDLHSCSPLAVTLDSRSPPPRQLDPMRQEK